MKHEWYAASCCPLQRGRPTAERLSAWRSRRSVVHWFAAFRRVPPLGSERNNLAVVQPVQLDLTNGRCLPQATGFRPALHTPTTSFSGHAIRSVRCPFVLADGNCSGKKCDRLPACEYLANWVERNAKCATQLGNAIERRRFTRGSSIVVGAALYGSDRRHSQDGPLRACSGLKRIRPTPQVRHMDRSRLDAGQKGVCRFRIADQPNPIPSHEPNLK
jgi:hypothetical protein